VQVSNSLVNSYEDYKYSGEVTFFSSCPRFQSGTKVIGQLSSAATCHNVLGCTSRRVELFQKRWINKREITYITEQIIMADK
jgi:hypothetical protein